VLLFGVYRVSLSFDENIIFLAFSFSSTGAVFFVTVLTISFCVYLWRVFYISSLYRLSLFFFRLGVFVGSMLTLILRGNLFVLFLGWEGLGVSSFLLIIFYQNWNRAKGGLLTLLTNRLGDALLLLVLCIWLSSVSRKLRVLSGRFFALCFLTLTLTKRAQWPFISWLPAAMAAPTPVSALVHSSTLVTAGVWLLIRFRRDFSAYSVLGLGLGATTLLVASLSAFFENDAKKIVALSTLSQLGMLFLALAIGNTLICFFHIIIHALAKANLFIVVGGLIHKRFSQQNSRFIISRALNYVSIVGIIISLLRLFGLIFTSGFFSKEQILLGQYFFTNRRCFWLLIILIVALTFGYCLKLFLVLNDKVSKNRNMIESIIRIPSLIPLLVLSSLRILIGWLVSLNLNPLFLIRERLEGNYWSIFTLGVFLIYTLLLIRSNVYLWFYSQLKFIDFILSILKVVKNKIRVLESSYRESLILISTLSLRSRLKKRVRLVVLSTCLLLILSLL